LAASAYAHYSQAAQQQQTATATGSYTGQPTSTDYTGYTGLFNFIKVFKKLIQRQLVPELMELLGEGSLPLVLQRLVLGLEQMLLLHTMLAMKLLSMLLHPITFRTRIKLELVVQIGREVEVISI